MSDTTRKPRVRTVASDTLRISDEEARAFVLSALSQRVTEFADELVENAKNWESARQAVSVAEATSVRDALVEAARRLVAAHDAWQQAGGTP